MPCRNNIIDLLKVRVNKTLSWKQTIDIHGQHKKSRWVQQIQAKANLFAESKDYDSLIIPAKNI